MAVAQLVERLLLTPEVRGSNPVIGKLLYGTFVYCQLYWKDENKEKEAENKPFIKKTIQFTSMSDLFWILGVETSGRCLHCCCMENVMNILSFSKIASFSFIFGLFKQINITIFTTNQCEVMSIQYLVLWIEPTTSWTRVVSHNH